MGIARCISLTRTATITGTRDWAAATDDTQEVLVRIRMQHWLYCNSCDDATCIRLIRIARTAGTQEVLVRKRLSANTSTNHSLTLTCDTPGSRDARDSNCTRVRVIRRARQQLYAWLSGAV